MDVARPMQRTVRRRAPEYLLLAAAVAAFLVSAGLMLGVLRVPI